MESTWNLLIPLILPSNFNLTHRQKSRTTLFSPVNTTTCLALAKYSRNLAISELGREPSIPRTYLPWSNLWAALPPATLAVPKSWHSIFRSNFNILLKTIWCLGQYTWWSSAWRFPRASVKGKGVYCENTPMLWRLVGLLRFEGQTRVNCRGGFYFILFH